MNEREESITIYAKEILRARDHSELRYLPYVVLFIDLILSEDMLAQFSLRQYRYALRLICGHTVYIKDEDIFDFLREIKCAYEQFDQRNIKGWD